MWIDRHNLVGIVEGILTPKDCLLNCKNAEECLFFTHFLLKEECYLYTSCEYFFYECENDDCISGESSCEAQIWLKIYPIPNKISSRNLWREKLPSYLDERMKYIYCCHDAIFEIQVTKGELRDRSTCFYHSIRTP